MFSHTQLIKVGLGWCRLALINEKLRLRVAPRDLEAHTSQSPGWRPATCHCASPSNSGTKD